MSGIILTILLVITAPIAALLVLARRKPDMFRVARSLDIKAPPERIFPLIDDLRAFTTWNPFVKTDPDIKLTYSGPASGKGAMQDFDGNKQAGAGRVTITGSTPHSRIDMALDMTRPFACYNLVEFTLQPAAGGTRVTWAMSGKANLLSKVMGLFLDMDKMVGAQFEAGLAELRRIVEQSRTPAPAAAQSSC
jgi:hypothetical protein